MATEQHNRLHRAEYIVSHTIIPSIGRSAANRITRGLSVSFNLPVALLLLFIELDHHYYHMYIADSRQQNVPIYVDTGMKF